MVKYSVIFCLRNDSLVTQLCMNPSAGWFKGLTVGRVFDILFRLLTVQFYMVFSTLSFACRGITCKYNVL